MKTLVSVVITGFLTLVFSSGLYAASSPVFRNNEQRTGVQQEIADPVLTPAWKFTGVGAFLSSPVVYQNIVYCGSRNNSVLAWDTTTGKIVWQYTTGGWVDASPCVSTDTVFVPCRDKTLYAFDSLTGKIRWQTKTGSTDCSSPVYDQGMIYLLSGTPQKQVYCLNATNGTMVKTFPLPQCGFSSPAIEGSQICFGTNDGTISCLNLQNGGTLWSHKMLGGILYSCVAISSQTVYAVAGGDTRHLFAFDLMTGTTRWQSVEISSAASTVSSVSVDGQNVYLVSTYDTIVSTSSSLYLSAYGINNGQLLWKTYIGWPHRCGVISSPVVVGNTVYVGSGDGNLYAINSPDGQYINLGSGALTTTTTGYYLCTSTTQTSGIVSSPCVSNGKIFVGTYDGTFWCLSAAKQINISSPDNNDLIINKTTIAGSVTGYPATPGFTLACGPGTNPSVWTTIATGTGTVQSAPLATWQTTSLPNGLYSLRLTGNAGSQYTAQNCVTIDNSPKIPGPLIAMDTPFDGGGSITLDWTLSSDDGSGNNSVTNYNVYKSSFNGNYVLLAHVAKGIATFVDNNAPVQTTFYYVITAVDAHSESGYSNSAYAFSLVDGVKITPETGGTVTLSKNGLTTEVDFEPGTVKQLIYVGMRIPDSVPAVVKSPEFRATNLAMEFGMTPANTTFLKPVTIKMPYLAAQGMNSNNMRICWWNTEKLRWQIVNTSNPLIEKNRVWATIPHFSMYSVMEYIPGREFLISSDRVYTYPNPAKGSQLFFKYFLSEKADVTIDIYTVAGQLIAHLEKPNNMPGIVSEIPWNCGSVASGVYIYRIQAQSDSQTRDVIKKLAIIH